MDGYSAMEEYSEGYPARPTATPVSSANSSRNTTEIPAGHVPRHHHESSGSGRLVMSGTSSAASYSAGNITVPDYRGSGTLGYAAHLSDVPTSGYATEPARFSHHLPPTSSVSAYEPRSYAFHPGGYPLQPRQELSYGQLSHSYIGQSQQSSLRTDSETYNAALALVQSQSKMFSDASGGQFYQLDSGAANSSSYEVVHSNLVDNSSQNVSLGSDRDHGGKVIYVSEKPQTQMSQDSDTVVDRDSKALSSVEGGSEGQVEVVVETIELVDATSKSDTLQGDTLLLLKADNAAEQSLSQVSANNPLSDTSSEAMTTQETPIDKQMYVDENQENATKTLSKIDKAYKDTASQVDGPDLESRFGILEEELKEFRGSKACCIKLKPVKKSYLDVSCNNIVFDIEIDNELIVSSIEKAYLTEKTSNYSFKITAHKDYYPKSTSQTVEKDSVSITVNPTKATSDMELLTENPTHKLVKEPPEIKIEKEEPPEKIMTRASKRKMAKPLKKTVLKQPHVGKSKDTQSSVEVKVSTKHDKTSKISKKVKGSESSKKPKESKSPKKEKESISPKKEKESKKKKSKSKSKSSKEPIQTDTDLEEAADRSDDYNSAAETTAVMEVDNEKLLADTDIDAVEVKSEITDEIKTDEQNNVAAGDSGEKVIIKQKKKRKKETEEKGDGKPKRVYQKRKTFSQTELNYSVRKSENGKRIYTCLQCNRDFNQIGNVKEHIRTHTGEKPFPCTICDKAFSSKSNINAHMLVHSTERNVICKECGFAFKNRRALNRHMRHHMNDRRWVCDYCGKAFYENCQLAAHQRVHTGERPYPCKYCSKLFRERSAWVRHMDIHSGRVIHQCHVCGKGFSRKDNYVTHLKQHQSEKMPCKVGEGRKSSARGKDRKTQTGNDTEGYAENQILLSENDAVAIRVPEGATAYSVTEGDKVQRIYFVVEERGHVGANEYIQPSVVTTPSFANFSGDVTYNITNTDNITNTGVENL